MGNQLSTPQLIESTTYLHSNILQTGSSKRKVAFHSYKGLPSKKYKSEVNIWTDVSGNEKPLPLLQYLNYCERMGTNPCQFHHDIKSKAGMITTFYSRS